MANFNYKRKRNFKIIWFNLSNNYIFIYINQLIKQINNYLNF
jgi:hypothetical protein